MGVIGEHSDHVLLLARRLPASVCQAGMQQGRIRPQGEVLWTLIWRSHRSAGEMGFESPPFQARRVSWLLLCHLRRSTYVFTSIRIESQV